MELPVILSLVSTVAVICSVIFAGVQVRNAFRQRSREAALGLANSIANPDFLKAMRFVLSLPDGLSKKDIEERVQGQTGEIYYFLGTCESLGILVFHRELSLDLIDDILSGPLVLAWRKLGRFVTEYRNELHRDTMYEWFQWLAERMQARESKHSPVPAYTAHRDWRE